MSDAQLTSAILLVHSVVEVRTATLAAHGTGPACPCEGRVTRYRSRGTGPVSQKQFKPALVLSACRTDSLERTRGVLAHGDDLVPGQHLADQIRLGRGFRIQQHVRQPRGDVLACQGKSQGLGSEDRDQAGSERAAHMTGSWQSDSVPQDAQYHR